MKPLSVIIQKRLVFIPIINCSILFIWIYNCMVSGVNNKLFLKSLITMFICALPFPVVGILLTHFFERASMVHNVYGYLMMYFIPVSIGLGLTRFQIKNIG